MQKNRLKEQGETGAAAEDEQAAVEEELIQECEDEGEFDWGDGATLSCQKLGHWNRRQRDVATDSPSHESNWTNMNEWEMID